MRRLIVFVPLVIATLAVAAPPAVRVAPVNAGTPRDPAGIIGQGAPQPGCTPATAVATADGRPEAVDDWQRRGVVSPMGPARDKVSIGPKQDDPVTPPPKRREASTPAVSERGAVAIGPKQDDPSPPPPAVSCAPAVR